MLKTLLDYYRLPEESLNGISLTCDSSSGETGFFQFGERNVCYGRSASGVASDASGSGKFDASSNICRGEKGFHLPFDFTEIVENLRGERYRKTRTHGLGALADKEPVRKLYYFFREGLPIAIRRHLQRAYFRGWQDNPFPAWPVDSTVDALHDELLRRLMEAQGVNKIPFIWFWPAGAPSCLIMTHDVETSSGRDATMQLIDLDDSHGIKSSFQVVPEKRYDVSDEYVREIRSRGCEFNVHDLNHDGQLYHSREEFARRAALINAYVRRYSARGFRAGSMYRNQDWFDLFEFSYDMSVPNVAHLEPTQGGCCTVLPYFVGKILELPLTTAQDYSLFHILNEYSIDLWKRQAALIRKRNGLMSFIAHPDYLIGQRERRVYESLLDYLRALVDSEKIWAALPGDVDRWWRARSQMHLVARGDEWEIAGPQSEKAQVAYATLENGRLVYEFKTSINPKQN